MRRFGLTPTFREAIGEIVYTDSGAHEKNMGSDFLARIQASGAIVNTEKWSTPRVFNMGACSTSGAKVQVTCDRAAVVDTEVHIRPGTSLKLRKLRWLVRKQYLRGPLLAHPIMEALGLITNQVLAAAAVRYSGSVDADVLEIQETKQITGRTSCVLDGVFHTKGFDCIDD